MLKRELYEFMKEVVRVEGFSSVERIADVWLGNMFTYLTGPCDYLLKINPSVCCDLQIY